MEWQLRKIRPGQSLIELLVAFGLAVILLPAFMSGIMATREGRDQQPQRLTANAYLREAVEAVRSVRANGWTTFAVNGTFHPAVVGGAWTLVLGNETISDGFVRSIVISDSRRDASGNLVATGGTVDPSTKKITSIVSWNTPRASEVSSELYVTRYLDNLVYLETTQAQFNLGTKSGTIVTNTAGGEVTLGVGGAGDWCNPNLSISALDLPKSGVANALTAIEGRVFAGTGDNASGVSFANVNVTNTNPPVSSILGTFDGYKTNGVFGEMNYAYLATDNNSKEVVIINLANLTESGTFNAPGNGSGNSVFVLGNVGYVTDGNKMYTFDLSAKSGARSELGNVTLAGTGNKVIVVGTYAYVATSSTTTQLQIIDVGNPSSPSVVGQASVSGLGASDVYVNQTGTRAYLATAQSASLKELFIIDISSKTGNRPTLGSYESSGMNPKGVTVVTGNKAILVGSGGQEYQVVDIGSESLPVHCGGLEINTGVNGVASVLEADSDAYSYIITGDSSSELKIIEGGPGGRYTTSGTFVSAAFDPGYSTSYNRVSFAATVPNQTSAVVQAAVSSDCQNYTFIGPDGTSNTFYPASGGAIPLGLNTGQCFKYKLYLATSDQSSTPTFNDLVVNYSP